MNINPKLRKLTFTALMAAIIFVVTFVIKVPLPWIRGYLNIGDAPIYLAAFLLGGPAGAIAAAIGSALSDIMAGYVIYAIPTAVIKGLMGLVCGLLLREKSGRRVDEGPKFHLFLRFVVAAIIGGAIMTCGYFVFEMFQFGLAVAVSSLIPNMIQWAGGVVVASAAFPAIKNLRMRLK